MDADAAALARAIADACLRLDAGEAIARDLRAFLEEHGVASHDIEAVLEAPRRLGVYRSLVRNNLAAVVARVLPRTRAALNAVRPGRFESDLARFLDAHGPSTPYLRDVPGEFVASAEPRWSSDVEVPRWVPDLAAFELAAFVIARAEVGVSPARAAAPELTLDRSLAFTPAMRVLRLRFAVHETRDAFDERPVHLLGYRDAEHAVRWLELTSLAAAVVERLVRGEPLGPAILGACEAERATVGREELAECLSDLARRGVILSAAEDAAQR